MSGSAVTESYRSSWCRGRRSRASGDSSPAVAGVPLDYHELERCTRVGYERGTRAPAANARQRTTFVAELSAENEIPECPKAWNAAPPIPRF